MKFGASNSTGDGMNNESQAFMERKRADCSTLRLCCPNCSAALDYEPGTHSLLCSANGCRFPILDGVPLMYPDGHEKYTSKERSSRDYLAGIIFSKSLSLRSKSILETLSIEKPVTQDIEFVKRLLIEASVLRKGNRLPELGCFEERFGQNGIYDPKSRTEKILSTSRHNYYKIKYYSHNFPNKLNANDETSYNVRIINSGPDYLDNTKVLLSYKLFQNNIYLKDGPRSPIPIPLPPGRSISIPLRVDTRGLSKGTYSLEIGALIENIKWFEDKLIIGFELVDIAFNGLINKNAEHSKDYLQQHLYSNKWLEKKISELQINPDSYLEIGCGCSPQCLVFLKDSALVMGMDVSHLLARLGYYVHKNFYKTKFRFIAGDSLKMPFLDNSFDMVTMYATFHHFYEPAKLIDELIRVTRGKGIIALMCEPYGSSLEYAKEDLLMGIDEKIYSLEEYYNMFSMRQLQIQDMHLDGDSLNVLIKVVK